MALGKKLVTEQGFDGSVDTLGRWMAHHIAELIEEAESASADERPLRMVKVRDAILALWTHRHAFPSGRNPFHGMEPIFNALESLDPDASHHRYFRPSHAPGEDEEESEEVTQYVETAIAIDRGAKLVVDFCLGQAAHKALDASKEWVRLADEAGANEGFDISIIRVIAARADLLKEPNPAAIRRRILTDRKQKLEVLQAHAADLLININAQLDELPPAAESGESSHSGLEIILSRLD
jgi:hypothetical protein